MTTNITYVRWQRDESRRSTTFPPLSKDHPSYDALCVICARMLGRDGDVQLLVIGPDPEDPYAHQHHAEGRWYSAVAVLVGRGCADALTGDQLVELLADLGPVAG